MWEFRTPFPVWLGVQTLIPTFLLADQRGGYGYDIRRSYIASH